MTIRQKGSREANEGGAEKSSEEEVERQKLVVDKANARWYTKNPRSNDGKRAERFLRSRDAERKCEIIFPRSAKQTTKNVKAFSQGLRSRPLYLEN